MKFTINFIKVFTISTLLFFSSCTTKSIENSNTLLFNCWTESYEENDGNESIIYRSCDYKIYAPNRYRNSFTLREDLSCKYWVLAPNDGHYFTEGTWELNDSADVVTLFSSEDKVLAKFKIVKIEENLLSLKRL